MVRIRTRPQMKMESPVKRKCLAVVLVLTFCLSFNVCYGDSNGGGTCAACDVIFGLVEQTSVIHNESIVHALERVCNYLPDQFRAPCKVFADFITPILIEVLEDDDGPDIICHKLGLCYTEKGRQCNLFPLKSQKPMLHYSEDPVLAKRVKHLPMPGIGASICDLPGIKEICNWINEIFSDHEPAVDLDGDKHSTFETLRGFAWRGKDCNDNNRAIHPGARPINEDVDEDSNCNGIKGVNPTGGTPYEKSFCSDTVPRGIAVLGDSISAHFHLPREWFNSTELSLANFEGLGYIGENELDWPAFSYGTGFMNATDTLGRVIHGATDSLYLRLHEWNRCNFRDYQNIAVNGARASSMVDPIEKSLYRNVTGDYPLIVIYALVGNDVCNGHPDTINHMTKPDQMRASVMETLQYLESHLPAGSHVFLTGLADGRVLYDSLKSRIHPIGSLRNDVTYTHFYDFFNCLEISPCTGWMNSNETLRDLTTKRAVELSAVLKNVADTHTYKNYKLYYIEDFLTTVIADWTKAGRPTWELLEPVDGFHANQIANAQVARVAWEQFRTQWPEAIGKQNPWNDQIRVIFGDQGGYR